MSQDTILKILENIKRTFLEEDHYIMNKHIEPFMGEDEQFLGDFFNYWIMENRGADTEGENLPARFYFVGGPFELATHKAPQHALVWENGELILDTVYSQYVDMRTAAMGTIALQIRGIESLRDRKVLMFGTGKIATWSLRILKAAFDDFEQLDYINSSNSKSENFEQVGEELGVVCNIGNKDNLEEYDVILTHTNAPTPVLLDEDIARIKQDATVCTFISSTEHGEVVDSFYHSGANVVLDWENNRKFAKDINRSTLSDQEVILLKDLLSNDMELASDKDYTIFRFLGTPMQNIAVLKTLLNE